MLGQPLVGRDIEELMAEFGQVFRQIAEHPQMRWLGPHKGIVHLALASLTNACFDLWAKARGVPLWKLLLDLTPEQVVATLDLSYLEDVLLPQDAVTLLRNELPLAQGARSGTRERLSRLRHVGRLVSLFRRTGAGERTAGRGGRLRPR